MPKPGVLTAIAVMTLVSGILNCLLSLTLLTSTVTSFYILPGFTLYPIYVLLGIYCLVVAIFEIIYSSKILPDPIWAMNPGKYVAIMQIVNVGSGSLWSLVIGILSLVFYSSPEVKQYYRVSRKRLSEERENQDIKL